MLVRMRSWYSLRREFCLQVIGNRIDGPKCLTTAVPRGFHIIKLSPAQEGETRRDSLTITIIFSVVSCHPVGEEQELLRKNLLSSGALLLLVTSMNLL